MPPSPGTIHIIYASWRCPPRRGLYILHVYILPGDVPTPGTIHIILHISKLPGDAPLPWDYRYYLCYLQVPPPLGTWTLYTLHALPQDYRLHVTWRCPHPRDYRHSIYMYVTWRFYASTLLHVCRLCLGHGTGALKNKLNTIYKIVLESDQKNMLIGGNESTDTKSLNQCNE